MNDVISTNEISFPVLLDMKRGVVKFCRSPSDLVAYSFSVKKTYNKMKWYVIDNDLRQYRVVGTTIIRGHGRFGGWCWLGMWLTRRVVFCARLEFTKQLDLRLTAELIASFIKKAEEVKKGDVARFWKAFDQFAPSAEPSLSALWSFYLSFDWGAD